ncbi:unnamed protein product [Cyclocybe aegerita]|uniref:Uncharacterized protein n=1 Tax=Cyclocybe aegerita TaxID=1973307 RepID=A0A8S0W7M3_CYCAE|nr:unnamed protein product [Cyclocybe aegerita]
MPSLPFNLTRRKHEKPKPYIRIRSRSGISTLDDLPNILGSSRARSAPRRSASDSSPSSSIDDQKPSTAGSIAIITSVSDMVLEPHHYAALLLQASGERDRREASGSGASTPLQVPPSTPLHNTPPRDPAERLDRREINDVLVEGITYDAILASNLNRSLGLDGGGEEVPPETRAPPNTPAYFAIQEGRFSSLMSVSLAIMEGRVV